jgi:hypothetical protein
MIEESHLDLILFLNKFLIRVFLTQDLNHFISISKVVLMDQWNFQVFYICWIVLIVIHVVLWTHCIV